MDTIDLNKISENLFKMVIELHKKTFNKDQLFKGVCLPPSHAKVLFHLSHTGSSSLSNLAHSIGVSNPNMTPIIDKLIQDGFITRYEDLNDRRKLRVELTEKATELLSAQKQKFKNLISEKLSILSEDDLISLEDSLEKITNIIIKLD